MPIIDRRGAAIVSIIVVVLALAAAIPPFIDATGPDSSKSFTQTEGEDLQLTGTLFADLTDVRDGQSFTEVASIHTTDTDFDGADTLENVTVEGSGESAHVDYPSSSAVTTDYETETSFESYPTGWSGDTGSFVQSSSHVTDGSNSLKTDSGSLVAVVNDSIDLSTDTTYRGDITIETADSDHGFVAMTQQTDNTPGGYVFWVQEGGSFIIYRMDTGGGVTQIATGSASIGQDSYIVEWNITSGDTVKARLLSDQGVELSSISADDDTYRSGGVAARSFGGIAYFDNVRGESDTTWPGSYVSETHSVNNAETGFTNVSLSDVDATVKWEADTDGDGTFETTVSTDTRSTDGNYTIDLSSVQGQNWRVNVTFDPTGNDPTARLDDEGILTSTTAGTDVNVTFVDTHTGQTVDTGPINESETRQFMIGGETVTVTNNDVLSSDRSLMTYDYPTYYGMDSGVETIISNVPLIALALGFIVVVMGLYAGRGI